MTLQRVGLVDPIFASMANALNQNAFAIDAIEDQMRTIGIGAGAVTQFLALPRRLRKLRKEFQRFKKTVAIGNRLLNAEGLDCVFRDSGNIVICCPRSRRRPAGLFIESS